MHTLRFIVTTICLLISITSFAQADTTYKKLNELINSQRQDKIRLQGILDGFYLKQGFERYKGKIEIIDDNVIQYDSITLRVYTARPEYKIIFEKGIFYPGVFIGDKSGGITQPARGSDTITALGNWRTNCNIIGVDVFEEVRMDINSNKTKRFRMWRWACRSANTSEYIFDLENETANEETSLENFIKDSKLTFIRFVTLII